MTTHTRTRTRKPAHAKMSAQKGTSKRAIFAADPANEHGIFPAENHTRNGLRRGKPAWLKAVDRERARLLEDLHDGPLNDLFAARFLGTRLRQVLADQKSTLATAADRMLQLLAGAVSQLRQLINTRRDPMTGAALNRAVRELTAATMDIYGIQCEAVLPFSIKLDQTISAHLFRVAVECVRNAARHAKASRIQIGLREITGVIELKVQDNGLGFPTRSIRRSGLGLQLMEQRARAMNAEVTIHTFPACGTEVICRVPRNAAANNSHYEASQDTKWRGIHIHRRRPSRFSRRPRAAHPGRAAKH